jgi:hypothetical protein
MNPNIWGPAFWFILHTVSLNYPQQPGFLERRNHYDFFRLLQYILPCETCRTHYSQYFKNFPIENFLGSRDGLATWVTNLHNSVNKRNGKEEYTQETSNQLYKEILSSKGKSDGLDNYFCKPLISKLKEDREPSAPSPGSYDWTVFVVVLLISLFIGGIVYLVYSSLK